MEVKYGKPALTTATALFTSGSLGNGVCLPLFLVLKIPKRWAKLPFCGWTLLHGVGFVSRGCPGVCLETSLGGEAFGEQGWGRQTLHHPWAQPGMQTPPALADDAQENASWGIAEISPARQGCKQSFGPCSCSTRSLCGRLVEDTQQYCGSGGEETNVWLLAAKTAKPQEGEKRRKKGKSSHRQKSRNRAVEEDLLGTWDLGSHSPLLVSLSLPAFPILAAVVPSQRSGKKPLHDFDPEIPFNYLRGTRLFCFLSINTVNYICNAWSESCLLSLAGIQSPLLNQSRCKMLERKQTPARGKRDPQRDCLQGKIQPWRTTIPLFILLRNKTFMHLRKSAQPWLASANLSTAEAWV